MDATLEAKLRLVKTSDRSRQFHLFRVQILRRQLRQGIELARECFVQSLIAIAEAGCGIPHLQIKISCTLGVVEIAAFRARKEFRRLEVMNRVTPGTIFPLKLAQLVLGGGVCQLNKLVCVCAH